MKLNKKFSAKIGFNFTKNVIQNGLKFQVSDYFRLSRTNLRETHS